MPPEPEIKNQQQQVIQNISDFYVLSFLLDPFNPWKERIFKMKLVIAFIFPWSLFMTIHKPFEAIVCLLLQVSILGWIPAAIWAMHILDRDQIA